MPEKDQYISYEEVEGQLEVTRATLLYYVRKFKIERKTFILDRKAYMRRSDFEYLKQAKSGRVVNKPLDPAA